jgi:hypothetical protein
MDDLTYIIDSLLELAKWSKPALAVTAFVLFAILYLTWTIHSKVDRLEQKQKILLKEIESLKKGESENG